MTRLALAAAVLLAAARPASADTIIAGGNLPGGPTTWTAAGSPYILQGDVTVPAGATLTIDPGVEVRATADSDSQSSGQDAMRVELIVHGALDVNGTAAQPVTLRSTSTTAGSWFGVVAGQTATSVSLEHATIQHARFGVYTQAPGAVLSASHLTIQQASRDGLYLLAGTPTLDRVTVIGSGEYGVWVGGQASPTLTNCILRGNYGGVSPGGHFSPGHTVTLDNCTIDRNTSEGLSTPGGPHAATVLLSDSIITNTASGCGVESSSQITITNTNVWNNTGLGCFGPPPGTISANPLYVSPTDLRLTSNSPSRFAATGGADQGALPYDGAPTPGLHGTLWSDTTLSLGGGPYVIAGDVTIPPNVTLTIKPGVTLSFQANSDIMGAGTNTSSGELLVRGRLIADGTPLAPITIGSTQAASGSWYGVHLDASAHDTVLDNVTINHAINGLLYQSAGTGNVITRVTAYAASVYGLRVHLGSPLIDAWASISAGQYGIFVTNASPTLTNCVVRKSITGVIVAPPANPGHKLTLSNCTLDANINGVLSHSFSDVAAIAITNSIITNGLYGIYRYSSSPPVSVTYSDVWNNSTADYVDVTPGVGTISANPQYVSATDLRLQPSSPAIDSGTIGPAIDALDVTRPLDGDGMGLPAWDMGAYELVLSVQCGNGAVEAGEVCDSGANNGMYGYCDATCTKLGPFCGDGLIDGPEQCDDQNTSNTDACLNTCADATCGDGSVQAGIEQCDDGNMSNIDACLNTCVDATCGDGYVHPDVEQCDDGNMSNTDACPTTCVEPSCGDGHVQDGVEECDDGNAVDIDACTATCTAAACGDGIVQDGVEECDDGNVMAGDGCSPECEHGPIDPDPPGGCCESSGRGSLGSLLLAGAVALCLRRRRHRAA